MTSPGICADGRAECRIPVDRVLANGRPVRTFEDFDGARAKVRFLAALVHEDTPRVVDLACLLVRGIDPCDGDARLARLHDWVQRTIRYEEEDGEQFDSPMSLIRKGVGDCEDHAALGAALAASLGYSWQLVACNGSRDDPAHLALWVTSREKTHVHDEMQGARGHAYVWGALGALQPWEGWRWSETTIAARYAEHPAAALARLAVARGGWRAY